MSRKAEPAEPKARDGPADRKVDWPGPKAREGRTAGTRKPGRNDRKVRESLTAVATRFA
ncbi:hypothetical protein GCM10009828_036880 [Actinoplanes couchii]|uniref:Uncharacterized protein n=1 Tax=Actinoplanes couchii TaxID=403638 RepID=A0ABQ3X9H1_9ACTN|nr:hypothetical protein Aco03nite_035560 [Actinoplanes couchii]